MLAFRSEGHLNLWLENASHPSGESFSLAQQWDLARTWFAGRHLPGWHKRTAEEAEGVFRDAGLTSDFWKLTNS